MAKYKVGQRVRINTPTTYEGYGAGTVVYVNMVEEGYADKYFFGGLECNPTVTEMHLDDVSLCFSEFFEDMTIVEGVKENQHDV